MSIETKNSNMNATAVEVITLIEESILLAQSGECTNLDGVNRLTSKLNRAAEQARNLLDGADRSG